MPMMPPTVILAQPISVLEKFARKLEITKECWNWTGTLNGGGYGVFSAGKYQVGAHRYSYSVFLGKLLTPGMHIDHLCLNKKCVNPEHLEEVTPNENAYRRALIYMLATTHCPQGHEYSEANTYNRPDNKGRECIQCHRDWSRAAATKRRRQLNVPIRKKTA